MAYTIQRKRALGGTSTPAGGGGAMPQAGGAAPAAPSGPGYVNFSRLLAANQGGAQRMADRLASGVAQKGQQAQGEVQAAQKGFNEKVQQGTLQYQAPQSPVAQGGSSAAMYRTAGAMQAQAGRGYEGPKDWAGAGYDTQGMAERAKAASESAKGLATAGGRGALLRAEARGPYSAGMSTLDSALSGAALGGRGRDLAGLYGGLSQKLIDYQKQGGQAVDAATTASSEAAKQYGSESQRFQALGDSAKEAEERAAAYEAEMRRRYPGGVPQDPRLRALMPGLFG